MVESTENWVLFILDKNQMKQYLIYIKCELCGMCIIRGDKNIIETFEVLLMK